MTGPTFRTAHAASEAEDFVHQPGPDKVEVTGENFPKLYEALETISHDSGRSAGHASYWLPAGWRPELEGIEAALLTLTGETVEGPEFETFTIGECSVMEEIASRSPELGRASVLLNEFFEDFSTPAAEASGTESAAPTQ
ncbi:MAG: hypothetical protein WA047_20495 [Phenylobacterium sp.]|uniref:hypothetical protein n=1 Tax=Phenylobacterium sp. TaxID=1871053 RepID=UPI003BB54CD9